MNAPASTPRALAATLTAAALALALVAATPRRAPHALISRLLGRPIRADVPPPAAGSPSTAPRTALEASEAFAAGYVAFLLGRAPGALMPGASPALRRRLAGLEPQLPAAPTAAPRVTGVRISAAGRSAATGTAVIAEGGTIDALTLRLARRASGWTVVDLAENG